MSQPPLSDAFESMRTTGNSAIMEPLARLQGLSGQAIKFGKDVHENFLSIADALHAEQAKDPAMADFLGRQILGDEGLTNLAKKGRSGVLAEEAKSPKISKEQAEEAQKLQAQLAAVRQSFQDIGNSILMDFGPAMLKGITWVKDLIEANRGLIETKVSEWAKDVGTWFNAHKSDVEAFGKAVGDIATAAGTLATAFAAQSPAMQALELFAVAMGGRVLTAITGVGAAMTALGSIPAPAWALAALGLSAVGTYQSAQRTAADMSDPKSADDPRIGINPDTGLTYHVDKPGADTPQIDTGNGVGAWFKSLYGFGPRGAAAPAAQAQTSGGLWDSLKRMVGLGDDPKTKENIDDTAKSTKGIFDILKNGTSNALATFTGVTASSGGLGGSGRHADGSSPGASLRDRQFHGKGNFGEKGWWTPERQGHAIDVLMKQGGLTEDGAKALVSRWKFVESAGGPTAVNPKSGAQGIAQWLGSRKGDGSGGSFDEQLGKVVRELNGKEAHAKSLLNTLGREANGASAYERAEGWNAATNTDNFTDRVREGMKHIVHGTSLTPTPSASSPIPSDADIEAIKKRHYSVDRTKPMTAAQIKQWGEDDDALSAHATKRTARPTIDHVARHVLQAIHKAQRLQQHGDRPIPVTYVDRNGTAPSGNPLADLHRWRFDGAMKRAHEHAAALSHMTRMAASANYSTHSVDRSVTSDTRINGGIHVHTAATDARGIAADIEPHLHRGQAAGRADYGIA